MLRAMLIATGIVIVTLPEGQWQPITTRRRTQRKRVELALILNQRIRRQHCPALKSFPLVKTRIFPPKTRSDPTAATETETSALKLTENAEA
jgi:hypothetical protein